MLCDQKYINNGNNNNNVNPEIYAFTGQSFQNMELRQNPRIFLSWSSWAGGQGAKILGFSGLSSRKERHILRRVSFQPWAEYSHRRLGKEPSKRIRGSCTWHSHRTRKTLHSPDTGQSTPALYRMPREQGKMRLGLSSTAHPPEKS